MFATSVRFHFTAFFAASWHNAVVAFFQPFDSVHCKRC